MSDILAFSQVWIEYGEKIVLENINLSLQEGAFVSVVGPSGAGKSTLLRLALGQEAPKRGALTLDGKPLKPEPGPERGIVFQRYSVFPHLKVVDNVIFGLDCAASPVAAKLRGSRRRAARELAEAMLARVGLQHALDIYPAHLSGGMQQRLAIAQALMMKPRILLLDEPFGALDPGVRLDMHALITELWVEHRLTILMVTHDIKEAFKLGTRVVALDRLRHDPQAPHRFGSTIVQDIDLDDHNRQEIPQAVSAIFSRG